MKTLVIAAHNNENLDWVKNLADAWHYPDNQGGWHRHIYDVQRPAGRESHAMLSFILELYGYQIKPGDEIVFAQGNPFDHDPDFILHLNCGEPNHFGVIHQCDGNSGPQYEANLDAWCDVLHLDPVPERILQQAHDARPRPAQRLRQGLRVIMRGAR